MRLIDADEVKRKIASALTASGHRDEISAIFRVIDDQETAYDIEKVKQKMNDVCRDIAMIYQTDQGYDYEIQTGTNINNIEKVLLSGLNK